jgi:outer membrane protein assembly factor BamA
VKATDLRLPALRLLLAASAALHCLVFCGHLQAQAGAANAGGVAAVSPTPQLIGRTVEDVRILGNVQVPTSVIRNVIRTKPGDKYDSATVQEDYQRVYELKKFANVEAQVEQTETGGVIVVFVVKEQKLIKQVVWRGNVKVDTPSLEGVVDLKPGQAIDPFRISLAKQAITNVYRDKNFPFADRRAHATGRVDLPDRRRAAGPDPQDQLRRRTHVQPGPVDGPHQDPDLVPDLHPRQI